MYMSCGYMESCGFNGCSQWAIKLHLEYKRDFFFVDVNEEFGMWINCRCGIFLTDCRICDGKWFGINFKNGNFEDIFNTLKL